MLYLYYCICSVFFLALFPLKIVTNRNFVSILSMYYSSVNCCLIFGAISETIGAALLLGGSGSMVCSLNIGRYKMCRNTAEKIGKNIKTREDLHSWSIRRSNEINEAMWPMCEKMLQDIYTEESVPLVVSKKEQ